MKLGCYIFIAHILITVFATVLILLLRDIRCGDENGRRDFATLNQSAATMTFLKNFLRMSVALSIPTVISLLIALAFEGFSYLFTAIATVAAALNTYYAVALGLRCKRLYLS